MWQSHFADFFVPKKLQEKHGKRQRRKKSLRIFRGSLEKTVIPFKMSTDIEIQVKCAHWKNYTIGGEFEKEY